MVALQAGVESEGRLATFRETFGEFATFFQRQEFLRGPQRGGCGARARAFQADFAEMQFGGGEVGVGRIVFVERPTVGSLNKMQPQP